MLSEKNLMQIKLKYSVQERFQMFKLLGGVGVWI